MQQRDVCADEIGRWALSSVSAEEVERRAVAAAAMCIFEQYWPGAREERIRRWEGTRFKLLCPWPWCYFVRTMLEAWCDVTFRDGRCPAVAPSPGREVNELLLSVGLETAWRVIWHRVCSDLWDVDRDRRRQWVWRAALLSRSFKS